MDPLFVWVASLVDIDRKRTGGQGGRHHRTRIYCNADVDNSLSQAALEGACAAFPDQAGMLREPTANRIYGVARVQVCDVYHEFLQLPSHEAEQLRVFRNKIRSDLVGNMYRVRVLNVQLLGECSVARSFAGQEMKALIVDLESGLGNHLAESLIGGRPAWLRHVPDVAVRLPALHAVCVASWQWPSFLTPCRGMRSKSKRWTWGIR